MKRTKRMNAKTIGVAVAAALITTTIPAHAQSDKEVQEVIQEFEKGDPGMKGWFADAYGYAVFPTVGKGAVGVGGARGKGLVYERGTLIGKTTLTAVTVGQLRVRGRRLGSSPQGGCVGRPQLQQRSGSHDRHQGRPHVRGLGRRPEVLVRKNQDIAAEPPNRRVASR
jgi:hypothetical protein